mmetsp:Transcript_16088/g.23634  ORF Transcript_16088/g.23634 Transcript_16088/m.23634 type:complete len:219 (-) Transcript_16088:242-898(-)
MLSTSPDFLLDLLVSAFPPRPASSMWKAISEVPLMFLESAEPDRWVFIIFSSVDGLSLGPSSPSSKSTHSVLNTALPLPVSSSHRSSHWSSISSSNLKEPKLPLCINMRPSYIVTFEILRSTKGPFIPDPSFVHTMRGSNPPYAGAYFHGSPRNLARFWALEKRNSKFPAPVRIRCVNSDFPGTGDESGLLWSSITSIPPKTGAVVPEQQLMKSPPCV